MKAKLHIRFLLVLLAGQALFFAAPPADAQEPPEGEDGASIRRCGEERDYEIVLDAARTREATSRVMKRFQIPADRSPDLRKEEEPAGDGSRREAWRGEDPATEDL